MQENNQPERPESESWPPMRIRITSADLERGTEMVGVKGRTLICSRREGGTFGMGRYRVDLKARRQEVIAALTRDDPYLEIVRDWRRIPPSVRLLPWADDSASQTNTAVTEKAPRTLGEYGYELGAKTFTPEGEPATVLAVGRALVQAVCPKCHLRESRVQLQTADGRVYTYCACEIKGRSYTARKLADIIAAHTQS